MNNPQTVDLIIEGGGVKGIGLVGAIRELKDAGYDFHRIAGTSSGAIVASLLAAGYTAKELEQIIRNVDYGQFADESLLDKLGIPGKTLSLLFERGIYEGDFTYNFVKKLLAGRGIHTFADLRISNTSNMQAAYKLVVIATDVTRGKLIRLPWDYIEYSLDPDAQDVAAAVCASTAIPFYYEPTKINENYIVDGGISSNFPIWLFEKDRHEHNRDQPTIGIKLSARPDVLSEGRRLNPADNTFSYALAVLRTILNAQDQIHLDDPCTLGRTIFVDTADIGTVEFSLTSERQELLYQNGRKAAEKFLSRWNFDEFLGSCNQSSAS